MVIGRIRFGTKLLPVFSLSRSPRTFYFKFGDRRKNENDRDNQSKGEIRKWRVNHGCF